VLLYCSKDNDLIARYCHFDWGENRFGVPNFPENCAKAALEYMGDRSKERAFDIGCAVGRSSFELARIFDKVIGVDLSARLIQEALRLKESGSVHYAMPVEGEIVSLHEVRLNKFGLEHASKKVNFWQADPCRLKPIFSDFDLVLAANLIERLPNPVEFLKSMPQRIRKGGMLILTSTYTWQEKLTPKAYWIGGYIDNGKEVTSLHGLQRLLEADFKLLDTQDIPFVFQETAREYRHGVAQMSVWERR